MNHVLTKMFRTRKIEGLEVLFPTKKLLENQKVKKKGE